MEDEEKYIKIERIGEVIKVEMKNTDDVDYLALAIYVISDVCNETKIPLEQILEAIKKSFKKGLVENSDRIYLDEINKENLN